MPDPKSYWERLFSDEECSASPEPAVHEPMHVVHRHGYPFLLLPQNPRAAQTTLELYPAQTAKARLARLVLHLALRTPFRRLLTTVLVPVHSSAPLAQFVRKLEQHGSGEGPIGILAGNPASPGQRFMLVVFGAQGRPIAVVKTGLSTAARELLQKESQIIAAAAGQPGVPRLREPFVERACAFALDYYAGHPPRASDRGALSPLLSSWLRRQGTEVMSGTAVWRSLEASAGRDESMSRVVQKLRKARFSAALQHGDFAPWNIKVSADGRWTALDWERGELNGVPAWDWFHYVLQPAILVERRDTAALVAVARQLLASPEFRAYSDQAGLDGIEGDLLLAYLLYMVHVVKPSEGLAQTRALLAAFQGSSK